MEPSGQIKIQTKHKTFLYHTNLSWVGKKRGIVHSDGKPGFGVSSPPEFKGEAGIWTPEDMFVAAIESCLMATFLAFAERAQIPVTSYRSTAEGVLEFVEDGYQFTKVIVRPLIVVRDEEALERTEKVLQDAKRSCLISNSVRTEIGVEPRIDWEY